MASRKHAFSGTAPNRCSQSINTSINNSNPLSFFVETVHTKTPYVLPFIAYSDANLRFDAFLGNRPHAPKTPPRASKTLPGPAYSRGI